MRACMSYSIFSAGSLLCLLPPSVGAIEPLDCHVVRHTLELEGNCVVSVPLHLDVGVLCPIGDRDFLVNLSDTDRPCPDVVEREDDPLDAVSDFRVAWPVEASAVRLVAPGAGAVVTVNFYDGNIVRVTVAQELHSTTSQSSEIMSVCEASHPQRRARLPSRFTVYISMCGRIST